MNYIFPIFFSSFYLIHFSILPSGGDEPNYYKAGEFTVILSNASECDCADSCGFTEIRKDYFVFNNATGFDDIGEVKFQSTNKFDSLFVYQRFEYVYGVIYSETEGVILGDTSRFRTKKQSDLVSYGKWHFLPANEYDMYKLYHKQENFGKTVRGPWPKINRKAAEDSLIKWRTQYDNDPEATKKYIKENNGLGIYVNGIELIVKIYKGGYSRRVTFYFPFRHGEC
jgi:hypothetical protein